MLVRKVAEEQGIVEFGYNQRNVEQYDLLGYYNDVLIASLWKDNENEWHWTTRLYGLESVVDMYEYHTDIAEVISEFVSQVAEWLNDEIAYLRDMYDDLAEEDIEVEI